MYGATIKSFAAALIEELLTPPACYPEALPKDLILHRLQTGGILHSRSG